MLGVGILKSTFLGIGFVYAVYIDGNRKQNEGPEIILLI
jgi:hypothetical protein